MKESKRSVFYELIEEKFKDEHEEEYVGYGIKAFDSNDNRLMLSEIKNISTSKNFVNSLVEKFNKYDLRIEHFYDVVYDFICAELSVF